jgi:SAM-dependent methyltransferase
VYSSAELYDVLFASTDYEGHAERVRTLVAERNPSAHSLLDVACGPGRHLERLQAWYEVEGLDADERMLRIAASRLPAVPLHLGDMRDFNLGERFDVVTCLGSAIAWMKTIEDMNLAVANMARHLRPGGVIVIEPWDSPDEPEEQVPYLNVVEEPDRTVVLLETTRLCGTVWLQETHYVVGTAGGVEHLSEITELGAFTAEQNVATLRAAGMSVEHDPIGLLDRGLYVGIRRR